EGGVDAERGGNVGDGVPSEPRHLGRDHALLRELGRWIAEEIDLQKRTASTVRAAGHAQDLADAAVDTLKVLVVWVDRQRGRLSTRCSGHGAPPSAGCDARPHGSRNSLGDRSILQRLKGGLRVAASTIITGASSVPWLARVFVAIPNIDSGP